MSTHTTCSVDVSLQNLVRRVQAAVTEKSFKPLRKKRRQTHTGSSTHLQNQNERLLLHKPRVAATKGKGQHATLKRFWEYQSVARA